MQGGVGPGSRRVPGIYVLAMSPRERRGWPNQQARPWRKM